MSDAALHNLPSQDPVALLSETVARIAEQHQVVRPIGLRDHLVDVGLTSMAMVDLMLAVEAEFDLTIPQREMTPGNFESIESLAEMLRRVRNKV